MAKETEIKILLTLDGTQTQATLKLTNDQVEKLKTSVGQLTNSQGQLTKSQTQLGHSQLKVATGSSSMNMAIMQSGYILNDASMIAVNFRMALMGVANNVPMVIQGLMQAKDQASGMGKTLGQVAMQSIRGPGGILLAVNALFLALQLIPGLFDDGTKAIEKQKDEVKKLTNEYEKLSRAQLGHYLVDLKKQLKEFEDKYPAKTQTAFNLTRVFGGLSPVYETTASNDDRFGDASGEVKNIEEKISLIQRELFYKGDIEEANIRIAATQRKLNNLTKENFAIVVSGAKSYDEAVKTLNDWIKADQQFVSGKTTTKLKESILGKESSAALLKQLKQIDAEMKAINNPEDDDYIKLQKERIAVVNKLTNDAEKLIKLIDENSRGRVIGTNRLWDRTRFTESDFLENETSFRVKNRASLFGPVDKNLEAGIGAPAWQTMFAEGGANSLTAGVNTFWDNFINKQREAKDGWDAIWLAMKDSALRQLRDILVSEVWKTLLSLFTSFVPGLGSLVNIGGSAVSAVAGPAGGPMSKITAGGNGMNNLSAMMDSKLDRFAAILEAKQFRVRGEDIETTQTVLKQSKATYGS